MNYWIALSIMIGWFPVFQTILHLEERERDNEMRKTARGHGKPHKRVIRKTPPFLRKPVSDADAFEIEQGWPDVDAGDAHYASFDK